MFAKIGAVLLIVLTIMGLIFCCCIPIVRSVIASRLSKEMALMVSGIEESGDWERTLYGEIDWSETREEGVLWYWVVNAAVAGMGSVQRS